MAGRAARRERGLAHRHRETAAPLGVPKSEFAKRDFYDVWYPNLSPSAELVAEAPAAESEQDWHAFVRKFKAEMATPATRSICSRCYRMR